MIAPMPREIRLVGPSARLRLCSPDSSASRRMVESGFFARRLDDFSIGLLSTENTRKAGEDKSGEKDNQILNPRSEICNWTMSSPSNLKFRISDLRCSGFPILIHLQRTVIVLPGDLHPQPLGPGIFLASLLRRLDTNLLRVILRATCSPDWYIFRHKYSYRSSIGNS